MGIRDRLTRLGSTNGFLGSVSILTVGALSGHALTAAALPILSRLYTPEDFRVLAIFGGLLSLIAVAACLRFDVAVPVPESDEDAANILALAVSSVFCVSAILALVIYAAPAAFSRLVGRPELLDFLWLLPVGVLLAGSYSALQSWAVRHGSFLVLARTRVGQSVAANGVQLGAGWLGVAPLGLLLGQILNSGAGCIGLGIRAFRQHGQMLGKVTLAGMRRQFIAHDRFPKFSTLEALFNVAGLQLPIILIAAAAIGPEAGYLALAMTAMQAPMALIGSAVGQVYLSRASVEHRAGRLPTFTTSVIGGLAKAGIGPLMFAGIVSPQAFAIIFGPEWYRAGELVSWMTPWFILQFVVVPVSMALHVTRNQRLALYLQLGGFVLRVSLVALALAATRDLVSEVYALSGVLFYGIYLAVIVKVVSADWSSLLQELSRSAWAVASWVFAAILTVATIQSAGLLAAT